MLWNLEIIWLLLPSKQGLGWERCNFVSNDEQLECLQIISDIAMNKL